MLKDTYQSANREIPVDDSLKAATISKMIGHQSPKKAKCIFRYSAVTAALAVVFAAVYLLTNTVAVNVAGAIATPTYPKKYSFNDYDADSKQRMENQGIDKTFLSNLTKFSYQSASVILAKDDKKSNSLYSPVSLYMAMAMLTESAKGQTQSEILSALSMNSMDLVSKQTGKLFRSLYYDNEIGKLSLANSVWLNKNITFNKSFLQKLATNYYAQSFSADFGNENTAKQIAKWVQQNTGGKLGGNPQDFATNPQQVMTLLNTVYFYDQWVDKFDASKTKKDTFHLADGGTVSNDFMNSEYSQHSFVKGNGFTSSILGLKNGNSMLFVLPDKGVSPYDLIADPQKMANAMDFNSKQVKIGKVTFKIPKFKFSSKMGLNDALETMGVKSAFAAQSADFSMIANTKPLYVEKVIQSATISIDEKGCEAAAYTQIIYCGAGAPLKKVEKADMILDRPFIFAILGTNDVPLFIGVINNPNA